MIYTITFNPSLDYIVSVNDFKVGHTNRAVSERIEPGGKGLNVSMMLKNLGVDSTALGFAAGFTGNEIIQKINDKGVHTEFIQLDEGFSRINLKLQTIEGTEINGDGPKISDENVAELLRRLDRLEYGDVLVLAGSIPSSVSDDIYREIMRYLSGRGVMIIVDATRDLLVNVLEYKPFLIKPNRDEIEEIFNVKLISHDDILHYAHELKRMGAQNVLVSMGSEGALMVSSEGDVFSSPAPKGKLINGVGAGDSMVAGFLKGWLGQRDYRHAFYMGVAAGSASAFTECLANKNAVISLYKQLKEGEK